MSAALTLEDPQMSAPLTPEGFSPTGPGAVLGAGATGYESRTGKRQLA